MALILSTVLELDARLFRKIFGWNGRRLVDRFMRLITHSGDGYLWGAIGLALLIWRKEQGLSFIIAGVIGFAIHLPLYKFVKNLVSRPRPYDVLAGVQNLIAAPDQFSFPSGHTAAAFLMTTLCAGFMPELCWLMIPWSCCIALSRVYLGVHYPLDVAVGAMWGFAHARLGMWLMDVLTH
jgi:undecaprenyl-diphosphatase